MKEALFWKKLKDKDVQCTLCPNFCVIKENKTGSCKVRKNIKGKLYSLVYSHPCSVAVDPIEKKPFYHFLPGTKVFSIGTAGCNLHCAFCQNYSISQVSFDETAPYDIEPEDVVEQAIKNNCKTIAYTYNEPTIFYEYMLEIAKVAKKKGLKNVIVSNGFINEEPLKKLIPLIDGANIDLKSFDNDFYKKIALARLEPVLKTLKILHENKVWLEITNLIIPTLNDNIKDIEKMVKWIKENLDENVPLHFSAFFPMFKLANIPATKTETLLKAKNMAEESLNYVYVGNIISENSNTMCPKCRKMVLSRIGFEVLYNKIKKGECYNCGEKIPGIWE